MLALVDRRVLLMAAFVLVLAFVAMALITGDASASWRGGKR
jgi:hypothetical protein